jgi:hypothetical protein
MQRTKMTNLEVTKIEADLTSGFAYIVFNNAGLKYSLQACLMLDKRYSETECVYTKRINASDSGFHDGICGDENQKAIDIFGGYQEDGYEEAFNFLKKELKKIGVKFL